MSTSLFRAAAVIAALCVPTAAFSQIQLVPVVSGLSSPVFVGQPATASTGCSSSSRRGSSRSCSRASSADGLSGHHEPRCSPAASRVCSASRFIRCTHQRPLLRLLHARGRWRDRDRRVCGVAGQPECRERDGDRAADDSASRLLEPQRRHARVRARRVSLHRRRRRRIRQRSHNNAQNMDMLLGKILRIDVDLRDRRCTSPPSNPFVGPIAGRDEIFASASAIRGGSASTAKPAALGRGRRAGRPRGSQHADPERRQLRLARLRGTLHDQGREREPCDLRRTISFRSSNTATRAAAARSPAVTSIAAPTMPLPTGTYMYGDYCTGEIFAWNGGPTPVLLDTTLQDLVVRRRRSRRGLRRRSQRQREPYRRGGRPVHIFDFADPRQLLRVRRQRNDHRHDGCRVPLGREQQQFVDYHHRRHRHRPGYRRLHSGAVRRKAEEAKRHHDGGGEYRVDSAIEVSAIIRPPQKQLRRFACALLSGPLCHGLVQHSSSCCRTRAGESRMAPRHPGLQDRRQPLLRRHGGPRRLSHRHTAGQHPDQRRLQAGRASDSKEHRRPRLQVRGHEDHPDQPRARRSRRRRRPHQVGHRREADGHGCRRGPGREHGPGTARRESRSRAARPRHGRNWRARRSRHVSPRGTRPAARHGRCKWPRVAAC